MKYKLFQGWWVRFYFCCALMMSTIVGILVFAVWAGEEDMILWDVGLEGLYAVLWLCMIFMQRRLLTYVVTEPSAFCAYSLMRRELCRIDLRQTVYYARFTTLASGCGKIPLIAISNEPFVYADYLGNIITRRRFIQGYDWKKVAGGVGDAAPTEIYGIFSARFLCSGGAHRPRPTKFLR